MLSDMVNDDSGWSLSVPDAATPSGHGSMKIVALTGSPRSSPGSRAGPWSHDKIRGARLLARPRCDHGFLQGVLGVVQRTEHSIAITSPPSLPITGTAILRHRSIAGDGSSPTWRSDCLDRDAVGVGSEGFDVRSVAGEDGAAGLGEGDDDCVDC